MSACPNIQELERLAAGQSQEAEAESIRQHVEGCTSCKRLLDECRSNQAFLEEVRGELRRTFQKEDAADTNSLTNTVAESPRPSSAKPKRTVPTGHIPDYDILRELHRGGQGAVYEAVQLSTKRKVAIKVLLEGVYASDTAKKRFDREIELVASLKHPNVIAIFLSGHTSDEHPFYVMDYIRGVPLHQYVRENHLSLTETLRLFVVICRAVAYAHSKGVIHRDLKPTNILVDATGSPRILDFGLARTLGGQDSTLISQTGQVVGTLPYVSPEQARGNPEEIDTRTDIYALGVMLYQILTGDYPYPVVGQLVEVLRHIAETEPTPPSKAWRAGSGVPLYAKRKPAIRASCPIDNEVETIVMKALAKEPERRYDSVAALARDLEHYLAGEPIEAKRDSGLYVMKKLLHRYRMPVGAVCTSLVLILSAIVYAGVQRSRLATRQAALDVENASRILAGFVADVPEAMTQADSAGPGVRDRLPQMCGQLVESASFTDRVNGARSGLLLNSEAFWASVDDGELWAHGEWLEVARVDWPEPDKVLDALAVKARKGSSRERYVALCLIGQMAIRRDDLVDICKAATTEAVHPGVVAAAHWAAGRLGVKAAWPFSIRQDDISGLTFVRIPASDTFKPGSGVDDRDRWPDERVRNETVGVGSIFVATTEVRYANLVAFASDEANADLFGPFDEASLKTNDDRLHAAAATEFLALAQAMPVHAPAGRLTHEMAMRFCSWLNDKAAGALPARRYRLPTEEEWEYAAMAGHSGRFCFGDDAGYVRFFGQCEGQPGDYIPASHMPNFFGLSDMHGGLWEWTASKYPTPMLSKEPIDPDMMDQLYVYKGGCWTSAGIRCRPAQRNRGYVLASDYYVGCRLVMEPVEP